ncbi:YceD family protein [Nocardia sp. NPDC127526]|uniref:YceD family protein n=1 Tax=Nocardia sp. NPDC127526 TaxID=3345393 RepID=UPI003634ACFC
MSADSGKPSRHRQHLTDAGFVLDTRSLGRKPGSLRELRRTVTTAEKIGLEMVGIPAGSEVELDLTLQSVSEGVLVTGSVHAPIEGECSRCLEPFTDEIELQLTELFAYPDSATEQTTEEDEIPRLVDDMIDLEPVIIDAVGLELPLQPLCEPDCAGLCPECGVRMAIAGSGHGHEILDPRWAGLANFAVAPGGDTAGVAPDPSTDSTLAGHNGASSQRTEEK